MSNDGEIHDSTTSDSEFSELEEEVSNSEFQQLLYFQISFSCLFIPLQLASPFFPQPLFAFCDDVMVLV